MCGADVTGAGTSTIKINGVSELHGCTYAIVPDMIEAGTYMVAAAAVGGEVVIKNVIPKHMETVTAKLLEMGISVDIDDSEITVRSDGRFKGVSLRTLPYPGFPTDMQPQFGAIMSIANGVSNITEGIFDSRFRYLSEIAKMGGVSEVVKNKAIITGQAKLKGAKVHSTDLRAGAALLIAAMAAEGETEITGVELIERGYFNIVGKLQSLGADIELIEM
jgi:UDP-N-acetylglucosamine 1-carboxyvinyltransferase